ncbi:hypothetical protein Voja6_00119 [Pseudomonas phage vB_PpuM-Voja-6]
MSTHQTVEAIQAIAAMETGIGMDKAEGIKCRGQVEAYIEEDGITRLVHFKPNLVVTLGAKALAHLLASADAAYSIASFKFGTKGHNLTTGDIMTPVAPKETDVGLLDVSSTVFSKLFNTSVDPKDYTYQPTGSETQVQYTLVIDKSEGNNPTTPSAGLAYTEAGMFCTNGNLFCRETFPALVKTNQRKLVLRWTIVFA